MPVHISYKDFYAICNHMHREDRVLRVGGTVVFSTAGGSASLGSHVSSGPPPISPLTLELDLRIAQSEEGAEVITEVPLEEFRLEDPTIEYQDVYFHLVGADGAEPPEKIEVEHPE